MTGDYSLDAEGNKIKVGMLVDVDRAHDDGHAERGRVLSGPDADGIYVISIDGFPVKSANYEFALVKE